jgi:putative ABC transport system permease protein
MIARLIYRACLRVLPLWLRDRAGEQMLSSFDARMAETRGLMRRARLLVHEVAGLTHAAAAARVQDDLALGSEPEKRWSMPDALIQDVRYSLRSMRRSTAVSLLAIATLALGVGTSTAMYTVIDGVLMKPMPFPDPDRVVFVYPTIHEWKDNPSLHDSWQRGRFSDPELRQWKRTQTSFVSAAGFYASSVRVPSGPGAERIPAGYATVELYETLGVEPLYGRFPKATDTDPVVVLTYDYWQTRHGGDAGIVGRDIILNDKPERVIGILPRDFEIVGVPADVWRTIRADNEQADNHSLRAIARLKDGVTVEQAEQESSTLLHGMSAALPDHITHTASIVSPLAEATKGIRAPLLILATATLLLLLAACANVALLLLGAGADRVRELAVRGALGARQSRLAMQLFVESIVLTCAGAAAGLLVATGLLRLLLYIAPEGVPRLEHIGVNPRTYIYTAVVAILSGVAVGCFPAFSLSRVRAVSALRSGATAPGRGRLQVALVVAELAFATVLLVGAGLLTRTMAELGRVNPGFNADGMLTMQLGLPYDRLWGATGSAQERNARMAGYVQRLHAEVAAVSGVDAVATSSDMPYSDDRGTNSVEPEGYVPAEGEVVDVGRRFVSGNYFDVMEIPMQQGRALTEADTHPDAERVMVVTDAFARRFWPDGRWLDRKVGFWGTSYRVVGIITDTREHDLRGDEDELKMYVPASDPSSAGDNFLIRTKLDTKQLGPALRERVWASDRTIVVSEISSMNERIARSIAGYRYRMRLMLAFSVTAALFCLLGVYGVMSRAVSRRRHELGIRLALGAPRVRILTLVLGDGIRIGALGAATGVLAALAATRALESMIWGIPRTDAVTFVTIAVVLVMLALVATAMPATRAAATEPMSTLRG